MIYLMHGCFFDKVREVPDGSIDMVFMDLPYGTTRCKWDTLMDLSIIWRELKRIRKDRTPIIMTAQTPFDKVLGVSNIKELRYEWIWEKTQATGHLNAKKMPMKAHENVLVFYKKLPTYNFQKTNGHKRKVSTAHHKRNTNTGDIYGKCDDFSDYDSTDRYPRSVMTFASDKQKSKLHPTQKPLALLEYLVKTYSNEGDVVFDGVMGSNTTGLACKNLGRSFIGIEKDDHYFSVSKKRVS